MPAILPWIRAHDSRRSNAFLLRLHRAYAIRYTRLSGWPHARRINGLKRSCNCKFSVVTPWNYPTPFTSPCRCF